MKIAEARKLKADMLKALRSVVLQLTYAMDFDWYIDRGISFEEGARLQESILAARVKENAKQLRDESASANGPVEPTD